MLLVCRMETQSLHTAWLAGGPVTHISQLDFLDTMQSSMMGRGVIGENGPIFRRYLGATLEGDAEARLHERESAMYFLCPMGAQLKHFRNFVG